MLILSFDLAPVQAPGQTFFDQTDLPDHPERERSLTGESVVVDAISTLKNHARKLHRGLQDEEPRAIAPLKRLRRGRRGRNLPAPTEIKRRHCLNAVAYELGFNNWIHARDVIGGSSTRDFGDMLYPGRCGAHFNIWSADYKEACRIREENDGHLLGYRNQFIIVDQNYIETLGLDPADPDWQAIGRNRVRPADSAARERLYGQLVDQAVARASTEFPVAKGPIPA